MSLAREPAGATPASCIHHQADAAAERRDRTITEEPLELRLRGAAVATLMRTPGSDRELALGFFLTEGVIASLGDVGALAFCARAGKTADGPPPPGHEENIVDLLPAAGARVREPGSRSQVAAASCGVCGKRTIDEVLARTPLAAGTAAAAPACPDLRLDASTLLSLPARLRRGQRLFELTGSVHAAGLFDARGNCLHVEEDVGRHNAVDKVIGWALLEDRLPLASHVLLVSGRVSFEIVQKAYAAGIPVVAAISGVSSLACDLAARAGITLVGFLRDGSFNAYTHAGRFVTARTPLGPAPGTEAP